MCSHVLQDLLVPGTVHAFVLRFYFILYCKSRVLYTHYYIRVPRQTLPSRYLVYLDDAVVVRGTFSLQQFRSECTNHDSKYTPTCHHRRPHRFYVATNE